MRLNNGNGSESGVLYLVNSRSNGQRFVRRPNPPPTSPPLDEDFDAITQDATTIPGFGAYEDDDELEDADVGELGPSSARLGHGHDHDEEPSHLNGNADSGMDVGLADDRNTDVDDTRLDDATAMDAEFDDMRAHRSTWAPTTPVGDDFDAWTYQTPTVYTGVPVEVGVPTNSIGRIIEEDRYDNGSDMLRSPRKDKGKGREQPSANGYGHHHNPSHGSSSTMRTRTRQTRDNTYTNGSGHVHEYGNGHSETWFNNGREPRSPSPSPTTLTLTRTTSHRNHRSNDDRRGAYRNGNGRLTSENGHPPSTSSATYRQPARPERQVDYYMARDMEIEPSQSRKPRKADQPPEEPRLALVRSPTNGHRRNGSGRPDEFGRMASGSASRHAAGAIPSVRRRGPQYEVVNNRILEDGPERTVTISTWREQVANEARRSEVEMSVYYVNADEYAVEGLDDEALAAYDRGTGRKETENGRRKDKRKERLTAARVEELRRLGMTDVFEANRKTSIIEIGSSSRQPRSPNGIIDRPQTPWPLPSELDEYEGEDESSRPHPNGHGTMKRKSSALMRIPNNQNGHDGAFHPELLRQRTSTPIRGHFHASSRSPPRSPSWLPRPSRERALSPLFDPISTMRNGHRTMDPDSGTSSSNYDILAEVLATCEPPLLHISKTLADLGITTEEHLRAVGKLKESTRNREVKEEALKRGITIMEWAILLDRLQSL